MKTVERTANQDYVINRNPDIMLKKGEKYRTSEENSIPEIYEDLEHPNEPFVTVFTGYWFTCPLKYFV